MHKRFFHTVLLFVVLSLGDAYASEVVSVRFRCLSLGSPIRSNLYTQAVGGDPIRIFSSNRTGWINYTGPNPIVFYQNSNSNSGQEARIAVGRYEVNESIENPLLLFSHSQGNKLSYAIEAIDDNPAFAPAGSYRIFNFTDKNIAGMIGEQIFRVLPDGSTLIKMPNEQSFAITVRLAESVSEKVERLFSGTWTFSSKFRYLVFIMPSGDHTRGNIKIRKIADSMNEQ